MYKKLGTIIIAIGVCLNEFTIKLISNYEIRFDDIKKSIIVIFFQVLIISAGIYLLFKKKRAAQNILLLLITFVICTIILELILSIPLFQNLSSDTPVWIPYKYKQISYRIDREHLDSSLKNKYGFNDINHLYKKYNPDKIRIAVLGDSFIWGDGVPDSAIWTRKLQKLFIKKGFDCEILNWGKPGWSTLDEYNFLKSDGYKYQFDYLVFAFVVNDPVMDSSSFKRIIHPHGYIFKHIKSLTFLFPNVFSFFVDLTNNLFSDYSDYGYMNWLNNKVYTKSNLGKYAKLLLNIKGFCLKQNINFSIIMTPENHNVLLNKYFEKVIPLFEKYKISYYNLYPYIERELKNYSDRKLWANPGDGHPGSLMTSIYSKYIYGYLIRELGK